LNESRQQPRFQLRHTLIEGEELPRGYGIAYRSFMSNTAIAYPVPFNWLVRASRWIRWKLKVPRLAWQAEALGIYRRGWERGRTDALSEFMTDLQPAVGKEVREQLRKQHHARRSQLSDWVMAARELLRDAPGPRSTSDERQAWEQRRMNLLQVLATQHPKVQQAAEQAIPNPAEFLPDQTEMRNGVYLKPTGTHADNPFGPPGQSEEEQPA
jgi:hypothetical protein